MDIHISFLTKRLVTTYCNILKEYLFAELGANNDCYISKTDAITKKKDFNLLGVGGDTAPSVHYIVDILENFILPDNPGTGSDGAPNEGIIDD